MSNVIIKHGVLSRLGFFINKQLLNTRVLAGSISAVLLTAISTVFNYQFGLMLSDDNTISQVLLPIGYSCLDIGALFIGGYIGLYAKNYLSKLVGFVWLIVLIFLSLFTAWSFQCATDHKKLNSNIQNQITDLRSDLKRYQEQVNASTQEKKNTKYHKNKDKYQLEINQANKQIEIKRSQIIDLESKNIQPEYAVFYRTPILKKSPEKYMTVVRFVFSSAIIFTPFVILYLMGIEEKNKTATQVKTVDISTVLTKKENAINHSVNNVKNKDQTIESKPTFKKQYNRIKKLIMEGKIKPSYRQIETKGGIGSKYAKAILYKLEQEQITIKNGQGWKLNDLSNTAKNSNILLFNK